METERISNTSIEDRRKQLEKEEGFLNQIIEWDKEETLPCKIEVSTDWGWRVFIYPEAESTEEQKRKLVAWFVRRTGEKFISFFREDSKTVTYWNNNSNNGMDRPLYLIERLPVGKNCKIVKETKTVEVNKLVCVDA